MQFIARLSRFVASGSRGGGPVPILPPIDEHTDAHEDDTMNTTARLIPALLAAIAVTGAAVMVGASREAAPRHDAEIVVLPTVEVIARRPAPEVVQLPTVTVIAKRPAQESTVVAQRGVASKAL